MSAFESPIDRLDGGQEGLAVRPGNERQAVPDQAHDAGLDDGCRVNRADRLGEALEAVDHGDENVVDAARLEFVDGLEPELGALARLDLEPENLLAIRVERERDVDGLVPDRASSRILTRRASKNTTG